MADPARKGSDATRARIREAAEQLFAREGFDRVTLRQIARAADQRNVAAVQYHFGSKEGLLGEIVEEHRERIDARRADALARLDETPEDAALGALIEVLVAPLAAELDSPSGRAYLRIQAQGLHNDQMRPATRRLVRRIGEQLVALDEGDEGGSSPRGRFALLLLFHALADRAGEEESGRARRSDRAAFVEALTRAIEGLFLR